MQTVHPLLKGRQSLWMILATAIAVGMLAISFVLLLLINALQWWQQQRYGGVRA